MNIIVILKNKTKISAVLDAIMAFLHQKITMMNLKSKEYYMTVVFPMDNLGNTNIHTNVQNVDYDAII